MKFGDKYELLESLTTGAIETFVANDKVRGERVLVHILDCAPQKPGQSTSEWVLESFRRVAPEPCGPVLETGKYSGTQYAYLVTKPADEAAQKSWVRRYEIQNQDTQETKTQQKPIEVSVPPVTPLPPPATKEPSHAPVSVTQLLRDFDSQMKPAAKPVPPAHSLPNLTVGRENSGLHSAPPWEPVHSPIVSTPKEEPRSSLPADSLGSDYKDKGLPSSSFPSVTKQAPKDSSKAGEFTSFFQGPFRGDGPSDLPSLSSQPIEPPRKKVGDFTAVFGPMGSNAEESPKVLEESGNVPSSTASFTGMFKDIGTPPRTFNTSTPLPPPSVLAPPMERLPEPAKSKESVPSPAYVAPLPPVVPPTPAVLPTPPVPSQKAPVPKPSALPGDGATGAFQQPSANTPTPVVPEAPVGPSPYTQIISREKLMASSADGAGEEEVASSPGASKVAAPAMPKLPGVTPPKMPAAKMPAPPPMPKVAAPKAPKLPKVDVPTPPPVSMMPLVITLVVLFLLAVLLVLYFVLRH